MIGNSLLFTLAIILFASCESMSPEQVLEKSIEYHGGKQGWEQIDAIKYQKTTQLFLADGSLESEQVASYRHQFKPEFLTQKTWAQVGRVNQLSLTGIASKDSLSFDNQADYQKAKKELDAALYVVWQPFKLLDELDQLEYLGTDTLEDETQVHVIKNQYYFDDGSLDNTWWFYFNTQTGRLEGNMVKHGTTYSYIRNTAFEDKTGLSLNKTRTSYRVDSLRTIEFVRAKYWYDY